MTAWIKPTSALTAATIMIYITDPVNVSADALDVWHTNSTISASAIAYGNGKFVAVSGTAFQVSADGATWTPYVSPPVLNYEGIAFGGGVFMTFGYPVSTNSSGPRYILRSYDGLNWVKVYETALPIRSAVYGNGRFVFVGDAIISTTTNPLQWTEFQVPLSLGGVSFGSGRFVAVSAETAPSANILSSSDAISWRYDYFQKNRETLRSVAYGNGIFVATWRTNYNAGGLNYSDHGYLFSSDLASWQAVVLNNYTLQSLAGITYGGGLFISAAVGKTYTSTNGSNWINRVGANSATTFGFGLGSFVASSSGSGIGQSDVFAPASNPPASYLTIDTFPGVTIRGNEGQAFRIEYTTNLTADSNWLTLTNISLPSSTFLWVDTSSPTLERRFYRAVLLE